MRYSITILCFLFLLTGCKIKPINQKINKKREGHWIEKYNQDSLEYKSIGKYKKGEPVKKWRYLVNNAIIKKEIYKRDICFTTFYHKNGKIQSKGKTKFVENKLEMHWFYLGKWKFFDENGKVILIKKYDEGKLISETQIRD